MSRFGNFHDFCRDSTLPVCNLFSNRKQSCELLGFVSGGGRVRNLGSIILCGTAILVSIWLIWLSEKKKAAVGRRETQIFLISYILLSIAEIFSVGGFLTNRTVLVWFSAIHIGAIIATTWILMLNAIVGYQLLDDGTPLSISLVCSSAVTFFVVTGYIAVDTGFNYTGAFAVDDQNTIKNYTLYVLYFLLPLIMIVAYIILESVLVIKVLGEILPMMRLGTAALLFAIGQVFNLVISVHLCKATKGKIDGAMFETAFTLGAVVVLWFFWSSITEDEWPEDTIPRGEIPMSESAVEYH